MNIADDDCITLLGLFYHFALISYLFVQVNPRDRDRKVRQTHSKQGYPNMQILGLDAGFAHLAFPISCNELCLDRQSLKVLVT